MLMSVTNEEYSCSCPSALEKNEKTSKRVFVKTNKNVTYFTSMQ